MREIQQLELFIHEHYATLCTIAIRFVGSPDIAQDIAQEVIIKYWNNRKNNQEINSTENYLYIMVKNEALNYLRGIERENQRYNTLSTEEQDAPQILNKIIEEETNQILVHAINQLPTQSARIMRFVLSGYENKEIAQLIGVSVNTIKTLKYGAIRKLKEYFDTNDYEIN